MFPDAMKRIIGATLGIACFAAILSTLAFSNGLPVSAAHMRTPATVLAAIIALVVIFWITEPIPIPVTALLGSALAILLGVAPVAKVLAPYADPIIFLFLGAFLVGEAIVSTGLDERLARTVLAIPAVRASRGALIAAAALVTAVLSMWMSNTAAAAIMMPLALSALRRVGDDSRKGVATTMVLAVAYAASLGGIATPIGTPPNLIAVGYLERFANVHLDFGAWMKFALPLSLALTLALAAISVFSARGRKEAPKPAEPPAGAWTAAQRVVAAVFAMMVAAWLLPSVVAAFDSDSSARLGERLHESVVALVGAILLFALPASTRPYRPILEWKQAARIDWGTILLFGGGLSIGQLVLSTGLGELLAEALRDATGVSSATGLIAVATGLAIVLTEFMSNTAAANIVVPLVYAMAVRLGVPPTGPVVAAALGASMAFVLPVSTPPNAIAYGTGEVTIAQMARRGLVLDAIAFAAIVGTVSLAFG